MQKEAFLLVASDYKSAVRGFITNFQIAVLRCFSKLAFTIRFHLLTLVYNIS